MKIVLISKTEIVCKIYNPNKYTDSGAIFIDDKTVSLFLFFKCIFFQRKYMEAAGDGAIKLTGSRNFAIGKKDLKMALPLKKYFF